MNFSTVNLYLFFIGRCSEIKKSGGKWRDSVCLSILFTRMCLIGLFISCLVTDYFFVLFAEHFSKLLHDTVLVFLTGYDSAMIFYYFSGIS